MMLTMILITMWVLVVEKYTKQICWSQIMMMIIMMFMIIMFFVDKNGDDVCDVWWWWSCPRWWWWWCRGRCLWCVMTMILAPGEPQPGRSPICDVGAFWRAGQSHHHHSYYHRNFYHWHLNSIIVFNIVIIEKNSKIVFYDLSWTSETKYCRSPDDR